MGNLNQQGVGGSGESDYQSLTARAEKELAEWAFLCLREGLGMEHPDKEVQSAITRLCDALCTYERNTGRTSAFILRELGGFVVRAASGKPNVPDWVKDEEFVNSETSYGCMGD